MKKYMLPIIVIVILVSLIGSSCSAAPAPAPAPKPAPALTPTPAPKPAPAPTPAPAPPSLQHLVVVANTFTQAEKLGDFMKLSSSNSGNKSNTIEIKLSKSEFTMAAGVVGVEVSLNPPRKTDIRVGFLSPDGTLKEYNYMKPTTDDSGKYSRDYQAAHVSLVGTWYIQVVHDGDSIYSPSKSNVVELVVKAPIVPYNIIWDFLPNEHSSAEMWDAQVSHDGSHVTARYNYRSAVPSGKNGSRLYSWATSDGNPLQVYEFDERSRDIATSYSGERIAFLGGNEDSSSKVYYYDIKDSHPLWTYTVDYFRTQHIAMSYSGGIVAVTSDVNNGHETYHAATRPA